MARRLRAFDTEVRYFDIRRPTAAEEQALGVRFQELDALLPEADIVSLHVPYTQATRRMLSRERIARLRPGAIVINTARGEVVDEVALAEALAAGHLGGAGLDVFGGEPPARGPSRSSASGCPGSSWRPTSPAPPSTTSPTSRATPSGTSSACWTGSPSPRRTSWALRGSRGGPPTIPAR